MLIAWLQLYRSENVGPITFKNLIDRFGTAEDAIKAIPDLVARTGGKRRLKLAGRTLVEREIEATQAFGANFLAGFEPQFPLALQHIPDCPPVLAYVGHLTLFERPSIAVVGARSASLNARKFAGSVAQDLGKAGYVITSGLARGIDSTAHAASLETGTIGVIAGGINTLFPPENAQLQQAICERGLLLAESPFGVAPVARSFPKRNRIIAGLSKGTLVVEAALRSGTLITARLANEYGREVFAVPGFPTDPKAAGCNKLIRDGAHLVEGPKDIQRVLETEQFGLNEPQGNLFAQANAGAKTGRISKPVVDEDRVVEIAEDLKNLIGAAPIAVDELALECQVSAHLVHAALTDLELSGLIERLPGNRVVQILSP